MPAPPRFVSLISLKEPSPKTAVRHGTFRLASIAARTIEIIGAGESRQETVSVEATSVVVGRAPARWFRRIPQTAAALRELAG